MFGVDLIIQITNIISNLLALQKDELWLIFYRRGIASNEIKVNITQFMNNQNFRDDQYLIR